MLLGAPASEQTTSGCSLQVRRCSASSGERWLGRPLTRLYAGITPATEPARTGPRVRPLANADDMNGRFARLGQLVEAALRQPGPDSPERALLARVGEALRGRTPLPTEAWVTDTASFQVGRAAAPTPTPPAAPAPVGTLSVTSSPSGAQVFIDNRPLGVTPLVAATTPGEHLIQISFPGYLIYQGPVTVAPGSAPFHVNLSR